MKQNHQGIPIVTCPKCGGAGECEMGAELFQTLRIIRRKVSATTHDIHKLTKDEVGVTAINNRVTWLFKNGYLTRTKRGKFHVYTPTARA